MFDKNTLRARAKQLFMGAIQQRRQEMLAAGPLEASPGAAGALVRVYVRKRPIFEKEEHGKGDFDVLSVPPGTPYPTQAVLHNCLFQADLKTPFISHGTFSFDRVFGEDVDNALVYKDAASHLVRRACDGGTSTMFMFGQTGSGKTHTMSAIEEMAARDLFVGCGGGDEAGEELMTVQFVELRGDRVFDLLAPGVSDGKRKGSARPELKLREMRDGSYVAEGAVSLTPAAPEDANAVSSRSHAVCTLRLSQTKGQLMLVDCAGTERRKDSMFHSKERQVEGAEINASLHALKECIRYLTMPQHIVPSHAFRASSLTKVLADAFTRGARAQLAVICTASPCASDTEHTLSTLRTGASLCGNGKGGEREEKQVLLDMVKAQQPVRSPHPKTWSPEQVVAWVAEVADGRFREILDSLPANFTGQMLVRLTESRCVQLCGGNQRKGRAFFDALHEEMQRPR